MSTCIDYLFHPERFEESLKNRKSGTMIPFKPERFYHCQMTDTAALLFNTYKGKGKKPEEKGNKPFLLW